MIVAMQYPSLTRPIAASLALLLALTACSDDSSSIFSLDQLATLEFGVPSGTVADQLVRTKFPNAKFRYYPTIEDAAMGAKRGEVAAAAYDEPILRNIAAKDGTLRVLPEPITIDQYGFGFRLGDTQLKSAFDAMVTEAKASGLYQQMMNRWLPDAGAPAAMPSITTGSGAVLRFGTAPVTEPFSFRDGSNAVVGFDVELAARLAARLGRRLEIVPMNFGDMIPKLVAGEIDLIGACITITAARSQQILFSNSYYAGGISALVRK